MTDLDLAELRRIAEAATPGPWGAVIAKYGSEVGEYTGAHIPGVAEVFITEHDGDRPPLEESDAEHIAAFDPPTALALIDRIEALEAERDGYRALSRNHNADAVAQRERAERAEARLARVTDDSPLAWADRHGDVWVFPLGTDLGYSFETKPFTRAHIEKKWGPLTPLVRAVAADEQSRPTSPRNPATGSYAVHTRKTARNGGAGFAADEQEAPDA